MSSTKLAATSLKASNRDKSSSLMFALIAFFSIGVAILAATLLMRLPQTPAMASLMFDSGSGETENPPGISDESKPLLLEIEDVEDQKFADSLSTVSDAVPIALSIGSGKSQGDIRKPGKGGNGDDNYGIIPAYERWELKFSARDLDSYSKTLDHFKIELGAIGGGYPLVDYAANFSSTPTTRQASGELEHRLYFMYRNEGPLLQYDRKLLAKAGIRISDRTILKFIPGEVQGQLRKLELDYAKKNHGYKTTLVDLAKTTFECQLVGSNNYQWVVTDQTYRKFKPRVPTFHRYPAPQRNQD